MSRIGRWIVMALATCAGGEIALAQRGPVVVHNFDDDQPGSAPSGFVFAETREAAANRWLVRKEGSSNVLAHEGNASSGRGFAMAVLAGPTWRDGEVSVRMRLLGGDRTGGLVWRYRDARNHSLVQFTLGEQSIGLYRIVDGNRVRLEGERDLELDPGAWHTLKIVQRDHSVRVYLGGIRVFEDRDRADGVAGSVGVWCAGGTLAQFDDLRVRAEDN